MRLETLSALNRERAARRMVTLVTDLESSEQRLILEKDASKDEMAQLIAQRLRLGQDSVVEFSGKNYFLNIITPTPRLVMIGAVHVSQALAGMAMLTGFDAIIVDPRTAFATSERFPNVRLIADWPDTALGEIGLDRYTAVVCLTHDAKIDDVALAMALRANCGYLGALGSVRTHSKRLDRLAKLGFGAVALTRIHAPIGVDIGAVSPAEIAVSILAEIILASHHKPLRSEKIAVRSE